MKIGIITYHQAQNYGALLQAISLRYVLSGMGHDVFFIDYVPDYHKKEYQLFNKEVFKASSIKRKIKYIVKYSIILLPNIWREHVFYSFISKYIYRFSKPINKKFDVVICGSDQIWRKQPFIEEYDPIFFAGKELKADRRISYAASLDRLPSSKEEIEKFCCLVKNFDKISVRELQTKEFLEQHNFNNVHIDLDPTLLLSQEQWENLIPSKRLIHGKYILLFDLLADNGVGVFDENEVKSFGERHNARVIRLRARTLTPKSLRGRIFDSPADFVNLIRYAECVLTSSYHGLVFSILMERPVYCCFPVSNSRTKSLLNIIHMEDRILDGSCPKLPQSIESINYKVVKDNIEQAKLSSIEYLQNLS